MIVTHVLPSAFTLLFGFAVTVESEWLTGPAMNVTVALGVILVPPTRAVTALVSARAEESRAVVSPFVSVSAGLVSELGFEAVDAGDLTLARLLEPYALLWIHLALRRGFGTDFGFGLLRGRA